MTLSVQEIADMRSAALDILESTAQVKRNTAVSDGMGGSTASWAIVQFNSLNDIPCLVAPLRQVADGERSVADTAIAVSRRIVTFPNGVNVKAGDRIYTATETLEITDVLNPRSLEFVTRVQAERTDQ